MKYSPIFLLALSGILLLGAALTILPFHTTSKDEMRYMALTAKARGSNDQASLLAVKQERKGVHKEIWQAIVGARRLIQIESPASVVALCEGASGLELVEKLDHAHCQMQEKLYFTHQRPMQELRIFDAKEATFSYRNNLFEASQVSLARFEAPGHLLPKQTKSLKKLMQGRAKAVHFKVEGSDFNFKADSLRASFFLEDEA